MIKRLEAMRENPDGNWTIDDVKHLCRATGLIFQMPTRGSHCKVSLAGANKILTIPSRRPIKPVYIRKLVRLVDDAKLETGGGRC